MSKRRKKAPSPRKPVVSAAVVSRSPEERSILSDWQRACDDIGHYLRRIRELGPEVEIQGKRSSGVRLPISTSGGGGSGQLDYSDTVLTTVIGRLDPHDEGEQDPQADQVGTPVSRDETGRPVWPKTVFTEEELLARAKHARNVVGTFRAALKHQWESLAAVAIDMARAIDDGRPAYSGRSAAEAQADADGVPVVLARCLVCGDTDERMRQELCNRHSTAWYTSKDYDLGRGDRAAWVAKARRRFLMDELVSRGIYGEDLADLSSERLEAIFAGRERPPRPSRGAKASSQ